MRDSNSPDTARAERALWLGAAAFALVYALLGWDRYATYHSGADLGLFTQAILSPTMTNTVEGGSHFTFHFSPILYALAPLVHAFQTPLVLVVVQAIACAAVAPALFRIAARRVSVALAARIAAIAFVYPPLAGVTFTDFHENAFVPAFGVWLFDALDAAAYARAALFALLLLLTKEDEALIVGTVAFAYGVVALRRRDRSAVAWCAGIVTMSACLFVAFFAVIRPLAGAQTGWDPLHFYGWSGGSRGPTTPLFSFGRLTYLLEVFGPLLFVPVLTPLAWLALPGLAEVLLSHEPLTYTMGQHYAAVWIPAVLFAYACGAAALAVRRPLLARRITTGALAVCVLVLALASPTHWGHFLRLRTAHDAVLDRFVAAIPRRARVATHDEVYAHLGFVPGAQIGFVPLHPRGNDDAPVFPALALFDATYRSGAWIDEVKPLLEREVHAGRYVVEASEDGVSRYRRVPER